MVDVTVTVLWFCLSNGVNAAHNSHSNTPFAHTFDHNSETVAAGTVVVRCPITAVVLVSVVTVVGVGVEVVVG